MLSCKEILARHSEYLDGEMAPVDAERWRAHLLECTLCARYDRVLREGTGVLRRSPRLEPDPEFRLHLRYRLAYEDRQRALGPVTAGAATSVSVAAVLALAAWLPIMFMARERDMASAAAADAAPLGRAATEIAWHAVSAIDDEPSHTSMTAPAVILNQTNRGADLIDPGYTPLILDPPTAPPSYTRVLFTSFEAH